MRKYLVFGLVLFLFAIVLGGPAMAQDPLAPEGQANTSYYAPFPLQITLDGDISDWEGVPRVLLSAGGDPAVRFAAASDGEYLYFLGDVTDSTIITGQHGANYWNEDSVEFYVNGTGDFNLRSYLDGVAQITVPALNADLADGEPAVLSGVQGSSANAEVKVVYTDTGYRIEMAIPLQNEVWNIEATHGNAIGFQVHLNGASEGDRDTKLIWSARDVNDQSYVNPGLFGYLLFYEIGQTDLPELPAAEADDGPSEPPADASALYRNGRLPAEARIIDLMNRMTLEEKIGQMTLVEKNSLIPGDITAEYIGGVLSGGGGYPDPNTPEAWAEMVNGFQDEALATRLGIPIIYGVDAVHGHNNVYGATIFPHNIGLGATRNADLVEQICHLTALETAATGIYWDYAPVLAVGQDIRWGRTYESYGENTDLVAQLGAACIRGLQGEDITDALSVLATAKHFVGDGGAEWGTSTTGDYVIDQGFLNIDEATLREIHLAPYYPALEEGALTVMISYSGWNGLRTHGDAYLINDVLKGEMGFEGFVVSDWAGMDMVDPDDYYNAIVTSINAGVDMNMVPYDYIRFIDTVKRAVNNGDISPARIDDAVSRILLVKFRMGLFERPYADPANLDLVGAEDHRAVARQAVAESAVLLKNDNDVLPISPDVSTILVAGIGADDVGMQLGGWSIDWQGGMGDITIGTTILDGLMTDVPDGTTVEFDVTGEFADRTETAEVGVVVVGERPYAEGRGDSAELALLPEDLAAIEALRPKVDQLVVVILSGRPLIITDYLDEWDAVVAAWLPGSEGNGVSDVLLGYQPFSGQLSFTWPASVDQLPQVSATEPLFPFGYGLTTTAQYE